MEKVNAINTILEAFGNAKTHSNTNATRFTQILSLDYDHCGTIASASVQVRGKLSLLASHKNKTIYFQMILLEKNRVGRRSGSNDHTFHVLERLIIGAEGTLRRELSFDAITNDMINLFMNFTANSEMRHKSVAEFAKLVQAFAILNVTDASVRAIWHILGAIIHLGYAGVAEGT